MSQEGTRDYAEIQASDTTDVETAIENLHRKNVKRREEAERIEHESKVRRLLTESRKALVGDSTHDLDDLLLALHWHIRQHPDLSRVLNPSHDGIKDKTQMAFADHMERRGRGEAPVNPKEEYTVLAELAKELNYVHAVTDPSQYAPVRYDPMDNREAGDVTPVARRRYSHDSFMTREEAAVEVPIKSCDHQLTMAKPRRGKDSTNVRCAGNLKDEHGYKWVSLLDDGRNETVMIAIPSDDEGIRKSLDRMSQEPKAYPCTVYIPAMGSIPSHLPANFQQFTLGTHQLTPNLVLRLVGITKTSSNTDRRIKKALDETVRSGGSVSDLCDRLREYAEESEATIEVVEIQSDPDGGSAGPTDTDGPVEYEDVDKITYQMGEDEALSKAAEQLAMLAGEGLIASPNAVTNVDFHDLIAQQDEVAILNCNFLDDGDKGLKYTLMDIWAQLLYKQRDKSARLPRVALEIREIKNICPSKFGDTKYTDEIKPLRQTIFFLTTQGGSRGVMLLGSTQKLTDMYKSARSNMAIEIILNLKAEGVQELDDKHHFNPGQRQQILEFDIGQGMVISEGKPTYPVNFAGARCGLGDKDREWIDRYGIAYGARVDEGGGVKRVRTHDEAGWPTNCDADYWIHVRDGTVHSVDEDGTPDLGTWFLLPRDLDGLDAQDLVATPHAPVTEATLPLEPSHDGGPPVVALTDEYLAECAEGGLVLPEVLVRAGMVYRQEYIVPNDLMLVPTGADDRQRSLTIMTQDDQDQKDIKRKLNEANVPNVLHGWVTDENANTRDRFISLLHAAGDEETPITKQPDFETETGIPASTVNDYLQRDDRLGKCIEKEDGEYRLTVIGGKALDTNWDELAEFVDSV